MKHLRKPTKSERLVDVFPEVGSKVTLTELLRITEIKNYNSLKAFLSYIRKAPHIPEENRVDIRIDGDYCVRVK